ncbi:hypothetical protein ACFLU9_02970 [Chloroflexota bacterium]
MRIAHMNKCVLLIGVLPLLLVGLMLGCNSQQAAEVQEIKFEQLFLDPDQYNGKDIVIEGYYYQGWETIVLSEELVYSGYAPGHLIPDGEMLWIEQGVPKEIYDKLNQQQQMGPFEHGEKYGHVGGFDSQIIPLDVELVPWSLPAE